MPKCLHLLKLITVSTLLFLTARSIADEKKSPNFWDEIPVSASTTAPQEIKDDYWYSQFQRVNKEIAAAKNPQIIFFGDSITWKWSLGSKKNSGLRIWNNKLSKYNPINMGSSGDITPVMLYRVTHGNLDFPKGKDPEVAVLLCGTNNFVVTQSAGGQVQWDLGRDCPPEDVAHGVRAIAQVFRRRLPHTRVIMMGILPVANKIKWGKCQKVNAFNAEYSYNKDEIIYMDLQDKFLRPDGSINERLFTDGTHLTEEGYRVWYECLEPVISSFMESKPLDPVKIMHIGGSIVEGIDSASCYRRYLDGMLRRKGNLIDFVGSRNKHHDNQTEPDSYEYDVDHEGHWGKNSKWLAENIDAMLADDVPDIAVIYTGTEDVRSNTGSVESLAGDVIKNINRMIDVLRSKNPNVKVIVSKIMPVRGKTEEIDLLNNKISGYIENHSTAKSAIVMADLHTGFDVSGDLTDSGFLPNSIGAKKMASVFAAEINEMINRSINTDANSI